MRKVFHGIGMVTKILLVAVLLVGHIVADLIGFLICAITEG